MSAIQHLMEEEEELQEFAEIAAQLSVAVEGNQTAIRDLIQQGKENEVYDEMAADQGWIEERLERLYEISVEIHDNYPDLMKELEKEIETDNIKNNDG